MNNSWEYDTQIHFIEGGFPVHWIEITGYKDIPSTNERRYEILITYTNGDSKTIKGLTKEMVKIWHAASGLSKPASYKPVVPQFPKYQHDPGQYRDAFEYRGRSTYIYDNASKNNFDGEYYESSELIGKNGKKIEEFDIMNN